VSSSSTWPCLSPEHTHIAALSTLEIAHCITVDLCFLGCLPAWISSNMWREDDRLSSPDEVQCNYANDDAWRINQSIIVNLHDAAFWDNKSILYRWKKLTRWQGFCHM
jgi:hypothetical protein